MNCSEIIELLPLYMENMLSDDEMASVREHLSGCEDCRAELAFLLSVKEELASVGDVEPSAEFGSRLRMAIINEGKRASFKPFSQKMIKRYIAAAASAAVIAISVMTLNTGVHELGNTDEVLGVKTENAQSVLDEETEKAVPEAKVASVTDDEKIEPALTPQKTEKSSLLNDREEKVAKVEETVDNTALENDESVILNEPAGEIDSPPEPAAFEEDYLEKAEAAPDSAIEQRSVTAFAGYEKVSFYPETLNDEALLVLADYEEENGIYKISLDEFYDVTGKLMMICGGDYKTESLNDEYNELLSGGEENSEALLEIEEICNWGYIVIEK